MQCLSSLLSEIFLNGNELSSYFLYSYPLHKDSSYQDMK